MTRPTVVDRAMNFAIKAHKGQKRKYTGDDYIVHPTRVAVTVASVGGTEDMIAAAWLHDVREDCGVTHLQLRDKFGMDVARYVDFLTEVKIEGENRATRKAHYARQLGVASYEVQTIKLADLIDNTKDIVDFDPKFARVYLAEKRALLDVLHWRGDASLWQRANTQIVQGLLTLIHGGQNETTNTN